jgi:hypothetical protein
MSDFWAKTASKRLLLIAQRDERIRALEAEIESRRSAQAILAQRVVDANEAYAEKAEAVLLKGRGE